MTDINLLEPGQRDDAAVRYIDTLGSQASKRVARSNIEVAARILLAWPPPRRPTRIGARTLHLDLSRVPWSQVTVEDAQRVREAALQGQRGRRAAGSVCSALRGVLRHAGALTLQHVDALRVDAQLANGRTVRDVVAEWEADDRARTAVSASWSAAAPHSG